MSPKTASFPTIPAVRTVTVNVTSHTGMLLYTSDKEASDPEINTL